MGKILCAFLVFLIACQNPTGEVVIDEFEMGRSFSEQSQVLFVEPALVSAERAEFVVKLRKSGKDRRSLYDEYVDVVGANGILDGIDEVWPKCHGEAHDLGKVIFSRLKDIGSSLRVCADRCYSGCMHGVLMEAFAGLQQDGHIDIELLKPKMDEVCGNVQMVSSYSPGDCAHGVGHALMFLAGYDIAEAIGACREFGIYPMKYYCATGAYMEYTLQNEKEDAKSKEMFYPCDSSDFPAACARYKLTYIVNRNVRAGLPPDSIIKECEMLEGKFRLGCFHGLGNGYMALIRDDKVSIADVCASGADEQFVCIEGAVERLGRYFPDRAKKVCEELDGVNRETCESAIEHGMYSMDKDFSLYHE